MGPGPIGGVPSVGVFLKGLRKTLRPFKNRIYAQFSACHSATGGAILRMDFGMWENGTFRKQRNLFAAIEKLINDSGVNTPSIGSKTSKNILFISKKTPHNFTETNRIC